MYLNKQNREFMMNRLKNSLTGRGKSNSELNILCDELEKEVAGLEKGITENEIPGMECMWIPGEDCDWYSKKTHCPERERYYKT